MINYKIIQTQKFYENMSALFQELWELGCPPKVLVAKSLFICQCSLEDSYFSPETASHLSNCNASALVLSSE